MPFEAPRPPIVVDPVLPDPGLVAQLATRNAPYWPVQRYFASAAEMQALSDAAAGSPRARAGSDTLVVGPVFRGDWAYDRPLVDGIEPFLRNENFIAAARRLFGADERAVVRPQIVYANLSLPMPCGDGGHTDVPAFRGMDRTSYPVWLLVTMGRSGLFERWRIPIATAVAWFYAGEGGGFTYWPDGPDRAPRTRPAQTNTAVLGDNDVMFHRVEAIGGADDGMVRGLTLDSQLAAAADGMWEVVDAGRVLARYPFVRIRISVSWKAQVFRDAEEARTVDEHRDDLALPQALETFASDLDARGIQVAMPADPLHDRAFIATLSKAYHRAPTVYPWSA
ncbi:MAG TPA: hypothetical protein VKA21_02750 [Candidatus Binatia bacterium]|nr:hypothetical protein [Candidatus Binatia bacterium]